MSQYIQSNKPRPGDDLAGHIGNELAAIEKSFIEPREFIALAVQYKSPSKPRNGMIAMADGTNWNPGSGAGFYGYRAGSWRFLG